MTDTRITTDDGSTAGKTTRTIRALARSSPGPSESDAIAFIDPKGGEKED